MELKEQFEAIGMEKPVHWKEKYLKNIDQLSKPIYEVKKVEDVVVYMRDGVKTYVDLYLPDTDTDEKFPGLVAFSAYGKSLQMLDRAPLGMKGILFDHTIEAGDLAYYVKRGYTVCVPDPRGVGKSEGCWDGLYGRQEAEDCYDVIEWLAVQPFCTGKIGMVGISYFSILQPLVAALKPPHLTAIMCNEVVDSLYHHNYPGGAFFDRSSIYNDFCPVRGYPASERMYTEEELKKRIADRLSDPDVAQSALLRRVLTTWPPRHQSYFFDVVLHNTDDDFWDERSIRNRVKEIKIPMYLCSEYYEYGRFTQGPLFVYNNCDPSVPRKVFLPEAHSDIELPHHSMSQEYIRWYDHWLKGVDTGIMEEPPIKLQVMGINRYRFEYEWPLARTQWTKYYLRSGSLLDKESSGPAGSAPDTFTHQPPLQFPTNCSEIPGLFYETLVLEEDVEVTGNVAVYLQAALSASDGVFSINLIDVAPNGSETTVSSGYLRASHRPAQKDITREWYPTHDHSKQVPVEPGKIYEYGIEVLPISRVFQKGHKIKITIKNSSPNNYTSLTILPAAERIRYDIFVNEEHPSYLLLPIIPYTPEENWID